MRTAALLLLLFTITYTYAQTPAPAKLYSVRTDGPKNDEVFSTQFNFIVSSAANDFERVTKTFTSIDVMDSTFTLKQRLPGANEATVIKSKESVTWSERFPFGNDMMGMFKLLQKVKAALPEDFVYTQNYDASSHIYSYTFFKQADSKIAHPGFPEEIHLNGDAVSGTVSIVKQRF